jgi:dTMP kinase
MFAARREHLDKVIAPALVRGEWVLCDRFSDATFAYQGAGRGMDWSKLGMLEHWVQNSLQPDLTLLFDLSPELGKLRTDSIKTPDRFELEQHDFFRRVREGYLKRAQEAHGRIHIIDASQSIESIREVLTGIVNASLGGTL